MTRDERPLATVPAWLWILLGVALAAQIAWQVRPRSGPEASVGLAPPPTSQVLRLAAFGESEAAARLGMLYLQGFETHKLDYRRLAGWLRALLELDPRSDYPLFAAARIYAESADPARSRLMLEFVYQQYLRDPDRRWPWLAHATLLAKHRLKDLPLARRYAQAIDRFTKSPDVPLWARQMEIFVLEDMNELEAAKILLGGLLESGRLDDPDETRFLQQRLEELERRLGH